MIDIIIAWHTIDSVIKIVGVALGVLCIIASLFVGGTNR